MSVIEIDNQSADEIIPAHFPFFIPLTNQNLGATRYRWIEPEFNAEFGPFATTWNHGVGLLNPKRKWDFWEGYRFKTERDAILFKLMTA